MNYIENNKSFQNRGYPNQTYNNQPFRGNQRNFNSNNNFNSNQPRPFDGKGGNYHRPPFQANQYGDSNLSQNRNTNYINHERLEKLENLITKSMEESNKLAIKHRKRIDVLGESLNRKMDGWDEKLDQMNSRVLTLENKIADVATSIKPYERGVLPGKPEKNPKDFSQYVGRNKDAEWMEAPIGRYVSFDTNEILFADQSYSDEAPTERPPQISQPPHYAPPLPFPDTLDKARKQAKAYTDIVDRGKCDFQTKTFSLSKPQVQGTDV